MRKLVIGIICILMLCGCGKITEENIIKEFSNKLAKSKSYEFDGKMQIISNEEKFDYKIKVSYLKNNYYKVVLVNENNNHEQIILRNDDGVYVITPSLNKSFKFQSEWPYNSSQAYILESLYKDLKSDNSVKYQKNDSGYVLTTKVNYPNNGKLEYEKLYFDKDVNVTRVEVFDVDDNVAITVTISKINYKANLDKDDFNLDSFIESECCDENDKECKDNCSSNCKNDDCDKQSSALESAIFPLYLPAESTLTGNEKIETDNGNRVILTFAGNKDFVLVEEASRISNDMEIIPVYGDPEVTASSVVALGANSLYWNDQNIDFYLASNTLSGEEMLTIASSMSNAEVVLQTK